MTKHTNQIFSLTTLNVREREVSSLYLEEKSKKKEHVQEKLGHEMVQHQSGEEAEGILLLERY